MAIKLIAEGVEECISWVTTAIAELDAAAKTINTAMGDLADFWEGAAYDYTIGVYESEYQTFLTETVPQNVESLRDYVQKCNDTILDVDAQLAGGGN